MATWRLYAVSALFLTVGAAQADLHPEKLTSFQRKNSPLLKRFTRSRAGSYRLTVVVGRYVVLVSAHQHQEMIRRNPSSARQALSNAALSGVALKLKDELIRQAKAAQAAKTAAKS